MENSVEKQYIYIYIYFPEDQAYGNIAPLGTQHVG